MPLTATSTDFLLLSQSVGNLWIAFASVVAGIGVVVAIVIVIVGLSQARINSTKLKALEEKLLESESAVSGRISVLEEQVEGETSRLLGIGAHKDNFFGTAYVKFLRAAYSFKKQGKIERAKLFSGLALDSLEKINKASDIADIKRDDYDRVYEAERSLQEMFPDEIEKMRQTREKRFTEFS